MDMYHIAKIELNEGDVLKIDTRDASYIERVSTKK